MDSKIDKTILNNKVIQEMIQTETSYNNALELLQLAFTTDVLIEKSPLLKEIKPHVFALKNISDGLLANVREAVSTELNDSQRSALRVQRTQFLKAFFLEYKNYAKLYDQFASVSKLDPDQFNLINHYLHEYSPNKLRLADHLIMPIQRGPRYAMLVSATKKMNEHLDNFNVNEFAEVDTLIADCLQKSNTQMADEDSGYKFGDFTRTAVSLIGSYRFGDVTRTLIWGSNPSLTEEQMNAVQISAPTQSEHPQFEKK